MTAETGYHKTPRTIFSDEVHSAGIYWPTIGFLGLAGNDDLKRITASENLPARNVTGYFASIFRNARRTREIRKKMITSIALIVCLYVVLYIVSLVIAYCRKVPLGAVALVSLILSPLVGVMYASMINEREVALLKGETPKA